MSLRTLKLRSRRWWRRGLFQTENFLEHSGEEFDRDFLGRLSKLRLIWRFVLVWTLFFVLMAGGVAIQLSSLRRYYQVLQPVPGGIYSEGIAGVFTTANPLYAVSDVDTSVSRLVFASLLSYDSNNHLTGDLADRWGVSADGMTYTVHLRPNLTWQDGQPLTAADVVFTYQTIQNPDALSPLQTSWAGVGVSALDGQTVTFTLPNPLSSFPYSLTNGIVPMHLLKAVNPADMRSADFNARPVGAGPFKWNMIGVSGSAQNAEEEITLTPFKGYWAGAPKLSNFSVHAYASNDALLKAYQSKEVTAAVGLQGIPDDLQHDASTHEYDLPLTAAVFVFFRSSNPILQDVKVRQALVAAADRPGIIQRLGYAATPVDEPLLRGQLGYDPAYAQVTDDVAHAKALLDESGWKAAPDGQRSKDGQPLSFVLNAVDGTDYARVAQLLHDEWKAIGVDARVELQQPDDFQAVLASHSYDAVVYGVSIGVDPDVFVYWDSSQADIRSANRLNFSEYKSGAADVALEAGRTRLDAQLRVIKYRSFLQVWQQDAPALALYQPRLLYLSHTPIYGLDESPINSDAGRFNNVENWMIHQSWVTRTKA